MKREHQEYLGHEALKLWEKGDLQGAEEYFIKAIRQHPDASMAYHFLTGLYLEQKQLAKAKDLLTRSRSKFPQYEAGYQMDLAKIASLEKNTGRAIQHLSQAREAGFDNDEMILEDPKLDFVRQSPEFLDLMGRKRRK
ncbi:MAG: tetratricopeptide repeat protein [Candidatus Poribacteria bacterium]|nr:tetratricopeptide repeat protein [Candidatus Poribacteria bacterium]